MNPVGAVSSAPPGSPGSPGGGAGLLPLPVTRQDGPSGGRFGAGQQPPLPVAYGAASGSTTGLGPAYGGAFDPLLPSGTHSAETHQAGLLREQNQGLGHGLGAAGSAMPLGLEGPLPFGLSAYQPPPDPFEQQQLLPQQHPAYGMMTGRQRFGAFGDPEDAGHLRRPPQQPGTGIFSQSAAHPSHHQPLRSGQYGRPAAVGNGNPSHDPYFDARFQNDAVLALEGMDKLCLNPKAEEFTPPPNHPGQGSGRQGRQGGRKGGRGNGNQQGSRSRSGRGRGGRRGNNGHSGGGGGRSLAANVRRTIYICDIDSQVTERDLAVLFEDCGYINDCRVCGDPNSALRFAFIEFADEDAVTRALTMTGTMLGTCPLRVLRSKTAIVPVNNEYLPRSHQECELVVRTVYAANIDKKVEREDVRAFFETLCGKVSRLRLLGDYQHATRIAFVEFVEQQGAMAALNCSGALLGSLPIRVSPSKTPVRSDSRDDEVHDSGAGPSSRR